MVGFGEVEVFDEVVAADVGGGQCLRSLVSSQPPERGLGQCSTLLR